MASYQDQEVRLHVLEDKIEFVMKVMAMTSQYEHPLQPGKIISETRSLLDLYRQMKGLGLNPDHVTSKPPQVESQIESPAPLVEIANG